MKVNNTTKGKRTSNMGASLSKTPMDNYLEKLGIFPDKKFADYSAYIEKAQKTKKSQLIHSDVVPLRGSIHISTGRIRETKEQESLVRKILSRLF